VRSATTTTKMKGGKVRAELKTICIADVDVFAT